MPLLFGKKPTFDHSSFYESCACTRTYDDHMHKKNFQLENTKPIFNDKKILTLHHLFIQHTFMELFKLMKMHQPISLLECLQLSLIRFARFRAESGGVRRTFGGVRGKIFLAEVRRIRAEPGGIRTFPRGFARNRGGRSSAEPIAPNIANTKI